MIEQTVLKFVQPLSAGAKPLWRSITRRNPRVIPLRSVDTETHMPRPLKVYAEGLAISYGAVKKEGRLAVIPRTRQ